MRKFIGVIFIFAWASWRLALGQSSLLPYRDPQLPVETRVSDLLGRMTLEEKLWQLFMTPGDLDEGREKYQHGLFGLQFSATSSGSGAARQLLNYGSSGSAAQMAEKINTAQQFFIAETRLGIPIIPFDEALHGLVREGATAFPQAIGLAATWDPALVSRVAAAIAREIRSRGIRQVLSPVVNVATDVRWGRVEESYGEDPLLSSCMGVAFVREFERLGVITTPKHFVVNHGDGGRDSYPVHYNERLLEEIYFPPFKACLDKGGARSLMISYNSLDGQPCSGNDWLLNKKLKKEWGFGGFVISDAGAVGGINDLHRVTANYEEAARLTFENGLDVLFQSTVDHFPLFFARALRGGYIDSLVIDRAVARVLRAKFELGLFENPFVDPAEAGRINGQSSHRELARQAARESIVLLKNQGRILPLSRAIPAIAVIGPDAAEPRLGGYSGPGNKPVSILEGIRAKVAGIGQVYYVKACARERNETRVIPACWLHNPGSGDRNGLLGEYWDNPDFGGAPAFARFDQQLDFNWNLFSPHEAIPRDWFAARWTGELIAPASGPIRIGLEGNDGFRLFIDDSLVIDNWQKGSYHRILKSCTLRKNLSYALRIEFCERAGGGRIKLLWDHDAAESEENGIKEAVRAARESDVALICAGIVEGEGLDRASLSLPGMQEKLIRAVAATGTPTVVLIIGGSAVKMQSWIDDVAGILAVWYPGEQGGHAVADVLFGDYNPAGRLPITFPLAEGQLPLVYNHKPTGRLDYYHDLSGEPLFPFGHGLSYTEFSYSGLSIVPESAVPGDSVTLIFTLLNSGIRPGDEVTQVYIRDMDAALARPVMELKAFKRVHLEAGEAKEVRISLAPDQFARLDGELHWSREPGIFRLMVGSSSKDIRLRGELTILKHP